MKKIIITVVAFVWANLIFAQGYSLDTTVAINNQNFRISTEPLGDEQIMLKINRNYQVIMKDTLENGGLLDMQLLDFNKDGNSDLMMTYMGNTDINLMYLFDPIDNNFKYLKGFDKYPKAVALKSNSKNYYSYHRAGCADYNWVSDLFMIKDFKAVQIGHIYGQGCDSGVKKIEAFKIRENKEDNRVLVDMFPYRKKVRKFEDKWVFIEKYWNENYQKFEE